MEKHSSKYRNPDTSTRKLSAFAPNSSASFIPNKAPEPPPHFVEALAIVLTAFVDLGFGTSAVNQARRAANDNRCISSLAEEFEEGAAKYFNK